ncbi:MAG: hypothetical protein U9O20_02945 [Patescibacteria group bacterium]|nr:hypothetical protein [Patescibacteria group bacterium]
MKIKRHYYCITDKYNKPDFRFLFEDVSDAEKKIAQIKNCTKGETLFLSKYKRDFFIDGIHKNFVDPKKKVNVRRGCWTALRVKKLSLIENIKPEKLFTELRKGENQRLSYSKTRQRETFAHNIDQLQAPLTNPLTNPVQKIDWDSSFLKTRAFAMSVGIVCMTTLLSVFMINHNTNTLIAETMIDSNASMTEKTVETQTKVMGAKDEKLSQQFDEELDKFVLGALQSFDNLKQEEFEAEILRLVKGSPMEEMAPLIAAKDRTVAAFLVGIAKKESNFGRRVPVLNGEDCFNYWGYRGIRPRMGSGGHTCFNSPQDAIDTVGGRLQRLVQADVDTPQEMVLWKCGSACHNDPMAGKWINDVNLYFSKIEDGNV